MGDLRVSFVVISLLEDGVDNVAHRCMCARSPRGNSLNQFSDVCVEFKNVRA